MANCLAHARRQFVEVVDRFPEECRHVLEALAVVYRNDALARQQNLSPQARLEFHQAESSPTMEELRAWLVQQFDQRRVEPNSALGGAISYLVKHWEKLTLFLRQAGAPLDNNFCEQALKKAILHRKNALFYKTPRGAHVGDVFMSLIYTCELGGVNPFDYLTALERHSGELSARPGLDALELSQDAGGDGRCPTPSEEDRLQGRCCPTNAQGLSKRTKRELIDMLVELAGDDRGVLRRLDARFELEVSLQELVADASSDRRCDRLRRTGSQLQFRLRLCSLRRGKTQPGPLDRLGAITAGDGTFAGIDGPRKLPSRNER